MSNMQWSLVILGGCVLIGVVLYNWWATRRAQPRHATPLNTSPSPAAIEPSLDSGVLVSNGGDSVEPLMGLEEGAFALPKLPNVTHLAIDPLIDSVVPIALTGDVSGEAVLAAAPPTRRVGSKTLVIEGLDDSGEWSWPEAGHRYQGLQVALQLANRSGPINNIEFSEFVAKVQDMADALGGAPEFPDMLSEVARAKELDQFASQHDAQLGISLRARGAAWSLGFIQHHALGLGLVAGALPGSLVLPAARENLPPVVTLRVDTQIALNDSQDSALREIRMVLDVPHVSRQEQAFDRMCQIAGELAKVLDADVVDEVGQPLPSATLAQIAHELNDLYDAMDQRELSAGSDLARRLFS